MIRIGDWIRINGGRPTIVVGIKEDVLHVVDMVNRKVIPVPKAKAVAADDIIVMSAKDLKDGDDFEEMETGLLGVEGDWIKCRYPLSSEEGQLVITGFKFRDPSVAKWEALFDLELNGGTAVIKGWKIVKRKDYSQAIYGPQSPPKVAGNAWFTQAYINGDEAWAEFRAAVKEAAEEFVSKHRPKIKGANK